VIPKAQGESGFLFRLANYHNFSVGNNVISNRKNLISKVLHDIFGGDEVIIQACQPKMSFSASSA